MKTIFLIIALIFPVVAFSSPSPFGLEIGKASIQEVKAKYKLTNRAINKYSKGEMYDVDVSSINFDGLQKITIIFSRDKRLLAVLATLNKNKFDYLLESLSAKYKLISKNVPFVGNKSAKFFDGDTDITLDAPHLSFQMSMNYINQDLVATVNAESEDQHRKKVKSESSQL